jgi:alpha-L-rhamnosidase
MKVTNSFLKTVFFVLLMFLFYCGYAKVKVTNLICEYHTNPIGIGVLNPRLSWQLVSDDRNVMQTAYEIRVKDQSANGKVIWNSGKVESDQSVNVEYNGPDLRSTQRVYWQVRVWDNNKNLSAWSTSAFWEMGLLNTKEWKSSWICMNSANDTLKVRPAQYYRTDFSIKKKIKSARVYVTSKGLYQLFINGQKVSSDLFTPGWTSYNKRIQYQVYDVTSMIHSKNSIGAILGDGWYRGEMTWSNKPNYYGEKLALLAQLKIEYTDGTSEIIGTDENWKVTNNGAIVGSSIYNGEIYDSRLEFSGWNNADFKDSQWQNADILSATKDILVASQGEPVRAVKEIAPVKILTTPKGEVVFDMGQNMVGWVRLKVNGNKGDTVALKFAEVLDRDGNFYTQNLRSAKATDTYILKGDGEEIFEPHFTFHGFRYVQIIGFPGKPTLSNITGIVIHSDMQPTGTFVCSDSLINQLQHNIQWGQRGNFLDVPTDCPQRDERLGWTGDAQVFSMTAAYNFNVASFYTKWVKDITLDQREDGVIPHVIPDVLKGAGGSTAWADACIIVPWSVYRVYGDKRILKEQYSTMKGWVEYMRKNAGDNKLWTNGTHYGDWLAYATTRSDYPGATTEKDLIATAYYFYSTSLLAKIAGIIGETADKTEYSELANAIKIAFNAEYVTPNGRLVSHTQTAYALALTFGLLPENKIDAAANYFAEDIEKFKHLTAGFVGASLINSTLSSINRDDLAFMLLMRKKYPSWLYPVTKGATTVWERWDGIKPDGTFQNKGMNSYNHYAYGAIGEWLYSHVAGIKIDSENPGYKHFFLAPHVGGDLKNTTATFASLYGEIKSGWKIQGDDFVYNISIPTNTTATVSLPEAKVDNVITEDALNLKLIQSGENVIVKLGSGTYSFRYPVLNLK